MNDNTEFKISIEDLLSKVQNCQSDTAADKAVKRYIGGLFGINTNELVTESKKLLANWPAEIQKIGGAKFGISVQETAKNSLSKLIHSYDEFNQRDITDAMLPFHLWTPTSKDHLNTLDFYSGKIDKAYDRQNGPGKSFLIFANDQEMEDILDILDIYETNYCLPERASYLNMVMLQAIYSIYQVYILNGRVAADLDNHSTFTIRDDLLAQCCGYNGEDSQPKRTVIADLTYIARNVKGCVVTESGQLIITDVVANLRISPEPEGSTAEFTLPYFETLNAIYPKRNHGYCLDFGRYTNRTVSNAVRRSAEIIIQLLINININAKDSTGFHTSAKRIYENNSFLRTAAMAKSDTQLKTKMLKKHFADLRDLLQEDSQFNYSFSNWCTIDESFQQIEWPLPTYTTMHKTQYRFYVSQKFATKPLEGNTENVSTDAYEGGRNSDEPDFYSDSPDFYSDGLKSSTDDFTLSIEELTSTECPF